MLHRDYSRNPHPPTCTCVECVRRRNERLTRGGVRGMLRRRQRGFSGRTLAWVVVAVVLVVAVILART